MAIRERFRRALHKSDSSDSMPQLDTSSTTTASSTRQSSSSGASSSSSSPVSVSLQKSHSSKLSRTFAFGSGRDKEKEREKKDEKAKEKAKQRQRKAMNHSNKQWLHPSQRPLTEQNLQHQEMLSHFTMTFGASNLSQIEDFDSDGVSPCCTRPCSIDGESRC